MSISLPCYLAMTAEELFSCKTVPKHLAWLDCHFALYQKGLSGLPHILPPKAMLVLTDRVSLSGHDPMIVCRQLKELYQILDCESILLDLQQPPAELSRNIVQTLCRELSCPVAVTTAYADCSDGPVFLSPPPLWVRLEDHLRPWQGRSVWLEAALDEAVITVTSEAASVSTLPCFGTPSFSDPDLFCGYNLTVLDDQIRVELFRKKEHLENLLDRANALGVARAVGLYQQLK